MHRVNIYDKSGEVVNVLEIQDDLTYLSGRVSKAESGLYYKGIGMPYFSHLLIDPGNYHVIEKAKVFYCGYAVQNSAWIGKAGIFQDRFQPYFSDFIGSCGPKELAVIRNSREFEKSAVEVLDCINFDEVNRQFYFIMNYKNDKKGYLYGGLPADLLDLMFYMVKEGWNFPWDKSSIRDVTIGGLVSDVADMFRSKELTHQVGTIYSLLYSLSRINRKTFNSLTNYLNVGIIQDRQIPTLIIYLLEEAGINTDAIFSIDNEKYFYEHVISNWLLPGRNCAHVEDLEWGNKVRSDYTRMFLTRSN